MLLLIGTGKVVYQSRQLITEGEMSIKADRERALANDVSANKHLEWASTSRSKFHHLRPGHEQSCCPKWQQKINQVDIDRTACVADTIDRMPIG